MHIRRAALPIPAKLGPQAGHGREKAPTVNGHGESSRMEHDCNGLPQHVVCEPASGVDGCSPHSRCVCSVLRSRHDRKGNRMHATRMNDELHFARDSGVRYHTQPDWDAARLTTSLCCNLPCPPCCLRGSTRTPPRSGIGVQLRGRPVFHPRHRCCRGAEPRTYPT
jgi:hypothetical protein